MIPSEEARRSRKLVRKYFESVGEPIELSDSDGDDEDDNNLEEGEEEGEFTFMGEEGHEAADDGFPNHE